MRLKDTNGFMTILGLLVAVILISVLYYLALSQKKPRTDPPTQQMIADSGIDTAGYQATLNSTLQKIKNVEVNTMRGGQDVNLFLDEMKRNQ